MLANEPLILFNTDSVQVMTLTRQFKAVGVTPRVILNTSQITTLINMVKSGHVGTFLYRSIVEAHPDIVGIPVMPSIEQRIGVIWKKGKYQNIYCYFQAPVLSSIPNSFGSKAGSLPSFFCFS